MTVHQPQNDDFAATGQTGTPVSSRPRKYRPLSLYNPFDYVRLLYWIWIRPDMLKVYRIRCDIPQRHLLRQQAYWLVNHMIWMSMLLWIAVPFAMQALPLAPLVFGLLLVVTFVVWRVAILSSNPRWGHLSNWFLLGAVLAVFGMITAVTLTMAQSAGTNVPLLAFYVIVIVACLMTLPIASIFRLKLAEKLASAVALLMGGGLSIHVFDVMEVAWIPISIIIIAIFLVGVVEDRFDEAKHNHSL